MDGSKKVYDTTKSGDVKHWELERCLDESSCPIDNATKTNLKFLIGIRHEIEHQMTNSIDEQIGAKLHACALNFNFYIKSLFCEKYGMDNELSLSISFSQIDPTVAKKKAIGMNSNVQNYIAEFEKSLDSEVAKDKRYAYRILYLPISVNRKGQADKVIEFANISDEQAEKIKDIVVFKDREKPKYKPKQIVEKMNEEGYKKFSMYHHTKIWKDLLSKGQDLKLYGVKMNDGSWYWYENWVDHVRLHCTNNFEKT